MSPLVQTSTNPREGRTRKKRRFGRPEKRRLRRRLRHVCDGL